MPSPLRYGRRLSDASHSQSLRSNDHEWHSGSHLTQRFQLATTVGEDVASVNRPSLCGLGHEEKALATDLS